MNIDVDATYRGGVLYPQTPLNIPDNTPVRLVVAPRSGESAAALREEAPFPLESPRFTSKQLQALIDKHSVSVGALPPDFSRADIYSDHD